jgi:hypothetical protein
MKRMVGSALPGVCCALAVLASQSAPATPPPGAVVDYDLIAAVSLNMGGTSMGDPGQGYAVAMTQLYIDPFFGVTIAPENQHVVNSRRSDPRRRLWR